jgi:phosphoribosyl 1,2-cyclic phosphodiesterase
MTRLRFLGTGGGRFVTIYQSRYTGGIFIENDVKIQLDPGPGAAVQMHNLGINPTKLDAILVSHCHTDHYSDLEVMLDAMTRGGRVKRGFLGASESVINGGNGFHRPMSEYHLENVEQTKVMRPAEIIKIGSLGVEATVTRHNDPTGIGFRFHTPHGIVSYTSDTELNPEIIKVHRGARVAILSVTRPLHARIPHHMSTEDAAEFLTEVKPEVAILTHMGMKFLKSNPAVQARWIEEKSGVRTLPGIDGMSVSVENEVEINHFGSARN